MRKALFILTILSCACNYIQAQLNIVPNNSFEEYKYCNSSLSFCNITNVNYWFSPNLASPDYYSYNCSLNNSCLPNSNYMGALNPYEGGSYVGIFLIYSPDNFREYISVKLNEKLKENKKYCIKFYIAKASKSSLAIKDFCLVFTPDSIIENHSNFINIQPTIVWQNSNYFVDTNWVELTKTFIAGGNERYLTIGNFFNTSNTSYIDTDSNNIIKTAYYYIDNITLYECEEDTVPLEPPPASDSSLHYKLPNVISPNADGLNDAFVLESRGVKEVSVTLYNRWGEEVHRHKISGISTDVLTKTILWDATHNNKPAPQGVYYYIIELSTKTGEVIIEKGTVMVL